MTAQTTPCPIPTYPVPEPGLCRVEPEVARMVEALAHLEQVWPVLLAAVGQGHEAMEGIESAAYFLRQRLATRLAESVSYRLEIE